MPRRADPKSIRGCDDEADAVKLAIRLSRRKQKDIADGMGVHPSFISLVKRGDRTLTSLMARKFAIETGWDVVRQYRTMVSGQRIADGSARETDKIALLASYTQPERLDYLEAAA